MLVKGKLHAICAIPTSRAPRNLFDVASGGEVGPLMFVMDNLED